MRIERLAPIALLLALALPAPAVDTPTREPLWVVTSAKAVGRNGELFISSVRIVNDSAAAATVDITYYPAVKLDTGTGTALGDNTLAGQSRTFNVPAGQTLALDDILGTHFGITSGSGGLKIESRNLVPLSTLSQILVANAVSADGKPGTYGFAIPGQVLDNAIGIGETGYVTYLSSPVADRQGYRSNLFLQSASSTEETVVNVRLVKGSNGALVGTPRDIRLGKLVQTQINGIASFFGYTEPDTNLTAIVTVTSGGPVFTGASVNDNATGSQIYSPPTKTWFPRYVSFGLLMADGGYGFAGRLDVNTNGVPDYLTAQVVIDNCAGQPSAFTIQSNVEGYSSTTFTPQPGGSFLFNGSDNFGGTWNGSLTLGLEGSVGGSVTYQRASGSSGQPCPGAKVEDVSFLGRKVATYSYGYIP